MELLSSAIFPFCISDGRNQREINFPRINGGRGSSPISDGDGKPRDFFLN